MTKPKIAETARQERAQGGQPQADESGDPNTQQAKYGATPARGSEMPQPTPTPSDKKA